MSGTRRSAKKTRRTIADVAAELLDQTGHDHITRGWLDDLHEIWDRAAAEGIVSDNEWIHPLTIHQRVIAALGRTKRGKELFVKSGVGGYAGTIRGPVGHYYRTEVAPTPRTDAGGELWKPCTPSRPRRFPTMTRNRKSAKKAGSSFERLVADYLRDALGDDRIMCAYLARIGTEEYR